MAAKQRSAEVRVRVNKEGQLDVFRQLHEEAGSFEEAADRAGRTAEKAMGQIERGGTVSLRTLANLRLAVDDYREGLERAEAAGREVTDEQRQKLAELEQAYERVAERAGEFGKAQQDARRSIDDATEAAGGQVPVIGGLNDIVNEVAKSLGSGAIKWAGYAAAVLAAAKAGWEAGKQIREGLNWLTDGEFDQGVQSLASKLLMLDEGLLSPAESAKLLDNQLNILRKNGIDPTGLSAEEVAAKVDQLGMAMQRSASEAEAAAEKYQKWKEGLGLDKEALDKAAAELADFIKRFAEENEQLSQEEIAKLFAPDVEALREKYARIREDVQPELQGIVDNWRMVGVEIDAITGKTEDAAGRQAAALEKVKTAVAGYRETLSAIPADLAAAAQASGDFIAPWEQAVSIFNGAKGAIDGTTDGATHLLSVFQALAQERAWADAHLATAKALQQTLEGVRSTAAATATEVNRALYGSPLDKKSDGPGGYDPYASPLANDPAAAEEHY